MTQGITAPDITYAAVRMTVAQFRQARDAIQAGKKAKEVQRELGLPWNLVNTLYMPGFPWNPAPRGIIIDECVNRRVLPTIERDHPASFHVKDSHLRGFTDEGIMSYLEICNHSALLTADSRFTNALAIRSISNPSPNFSTPHVPIILLTPCAQVHAVRVVERKAAAIREFVAHTRKTGRFDVLELSSR